MKVLVIGGYGVFGERVARLLMRDGHAVTIAGRTLAAAQALARELGCDARALDHAQDLTPLRDFAVVVDASGPFTTRAKDPYRVARACISAGVHYLDLSDNADFCAGIAQLDAAARAAGVCVLSGVSSVPALSSAAVDALTGGDRPKVIEATILPGNRAPRGLSVMQSILSNAGRPMRLWRGGAWETVPGWSDPAWYDLPGGIKRQGWLIEVPDTRLFPGHYGADSVLFRAGLELGIMRYGLAGFAQVQRVFDIPVTRPLVQVFKLAADLLAPFGTGRGGMVVRVTTQGDVREWRLLAEDGDGPFIPAIAIRALLRRPALPIGARPAIGVLTLAEAEEAMADLSVRVERIETPQRAIFQQVLGEDFDALSRELRATHRTADITRWRGRGQVNRGQGAWPRLIAALFRFPPAGDDVDVTVTKTATPRGETWVRAFGARRFHSHLAVTPDGMTERFGPLTFLLGLHVADGALHYPVRAARAGPLRLPRWLLPRVEAREYVRDGVFRFDVALFAPVTSGLIVRYRGWLGAEQQRAAAD